MGLDVQPVRLGLKGYKQVKQSYMRTLPKYGRGPWTWLLIKDRYQRADFMAFYDQEQFVGFTCVIHSHGIHYILYLAVNDQIRSQGYGTRIIDELRHLYSEDSLALDVEQPNPQAANNQQRLQRLKFYRCNGFFPAPKLFKKEKVTFQVLATNKKINQRKINKAFEWFSWSFGWLI